ncbi:hypothetical protein yinte0001_20270 [Yersinia intermedia ATCC 29909]|nr:hypothetical protein yinte0001_20270 [Yersinia intermedia ATCC 29909]
MVFLYVIQASILVGRLNINPFDFVFATDERRTQLHTPAISMVIR